MAETWRTLAALAQERQTTIARMHQEVVEAHLPITKDARLSPNAQERLNRYLLKRYHVKTGERLPHVC